MKAGPKFCVTSIWWSQNWYN